MTSLALTISETLRYRGKLGQWSWVLHRISGLGTLFFLYLHVIDTSWAAFYPGLYARAISLYQSPLFTLGEFGLVACVVYHGLNGFRIVLLDWRPKWWRYQQRAANLVLAGTIILLIPTFGLMFAEAIRHYTNLPVFNIDSFKIPELITDVGQFLVGAVALLIGGVVLSAGYSALPGANKAREVVGNRVVHKRSRFDTFMWTYMRASGVLIIPLAFGHLAMMHVIQGVFRLTDPNWATIGTTMVNQSGSAVEFVMNRWNYAVAGVMVWRLYDIALLVLVVIHGFYGLHYVVNDYVHNKLVNRGFQIAALITAVILITVGGAAIIAGVPQAALDLMKNTAQVVH